MEIKMTINKKEFNRLLNRLSTDQKDMVIKDSLFESAQYIVGWIKNERLSGPRPTYLGVVTGRLRSSIGSARTEKVSNMYICRIGTNVIYARAHEYGYSPRNLPPRPFMRPAISDVNNIQKVKDDLARNINSLLERK